MDVTKKINLSELNEAIKPMPNPNSICIGDHHKVEKHFQQLKPKTVEATCRCLTCGLDW